MSKNLYRPETEDFWDDCIKNELSKKRKNNHSNLKTHFSENKNNSSENNINYNSNKGKKNKFLNKHKLIKKILNTEQSIPKIKEKNQSKQIEILTTLYKKEIFGKNKLQKELELKRENKIKAELENCTFKPEKKSNKNRSYEDGYKKYFGKKNIYDRDKYYKDKYKNKIKGAKKKIFEDQKGEKFAFKPKIEQKNINKVLYEDSFWEKQANNFNNKLFLWRYMKARKNEADKKKRLIWSMVKREKNHKNKSNENINGKRIITNNKTVHRSISQKDSLIYYKKSLHFTLLNYKTNNNDNNNESIKKN